MNKVSVSRVELQAKLQSNLAEHEKLYAEAVKGYKKAKMEALVDLAAKASASPEGVDVSLRSLTDLDRPRSHSDDYNVILQMVMASKDNVIELTNSEFRTYWMNQWAWSEGFSMSNSKYLK